ncbi:hypothetical protein Baya_11048 [Bagarius yarrelli]|uniref:Uncharacterized protein n=1 Tax=Bagarius yarrelli TaxID=175774 RepID=A0A556UZ11_BAGYA|nr:hypothetical protein Baya_11048 [Bagarius yarrelli]
MEEAKCPDKWTEIRSEPGLSHMLITPTREDAGLFVVLKGYLLTGSKDKRPADASLFILLKSRGSWLMPRFDVSEDVESLDAFDSAAGEAEWKDSRLPCQPIDSSVQFRSPRQPLISLAVIVILMLRGLFETGLLGTSLDFDWLEQQV